MYKDNQSLLVEESLYATSNGYIGVRGNFEEGYGNDYDTNRATYLNGFYDTHSIRYPENAYGFPDTGETIVNVMETQTIKIFINGSCFDLSSGKVLSIHRDLDLDGGFVSRMVHWLSPNGHEVELTFKRLTSFVTLELFMILITVKAVNFSGEVKLESYVDTKSVGLKDTDDPRVVTEHVPPIIHEQSEIKNEILVMTARTANSHEKVQAVVGHNLEGEWTTKGETSIFTANQKLMKGQVLTFVKYNIYTDTRRHQVNQGIDIYETVKSQGHEEQLMLQKSYLNDFWKSCAIEIHGDEDLTQAIRFSQYQLLCASGKDGCSQVAAKGLTGNGYEGHYFWDTEIYVQPFFTYTNPDLSRQLLKYRYEILTASKDRAAKLGHGMGAKIPWRTIAGRECSSYFPAGTAQYHINADVAYAYIQYYLMTQDDGMMSEFGYEVLVETAKLWIDVGHFHQGEFRIDAVTGPDEYTALVNNNYYTNAMAKYHMSWVVKLYEKFNQYYPVEKSLIEAMAKAADHMRLPYDPDLGIHAQDDDFLQKKVWDFQASKDKHPLLLHYHPLTIYRHQVLKQADTLLAYFLLDDVDEAIMERSYRYYEAITTHDSSLSPCVYGMMASRINQPELAYEFLMKTVYLDLKDLHANTKDGVHIANAGGTFMAIVNGFGGLRIKEEGVHLRPSKPKEWQAYSFCFTYGASLIKVTVGDQLTIETSQPVDLIIDGETYHIESFLEVSYHGKH